MKSTMSPQFQAVATRSGGSSGRMARLAGRVHREKEGRSWPAATGEVVRPSQARRHCRTSSSTVHPAGQRRCKERNSSTVPISTGRGRDRVRKLADAFSTRAVRNSTRHRDIECGTCSGERAPWR